MAVPTDEHLQARAHRVRDGLSRARQQLTTAESCTGGWVAKLLTDIPGSSSWFERGFVTYTNLSKQELLGVPADIIASEGAVSEATVRAMARGALQHSHADRSVAISGIAGPGGGSRDKPLGLVWFAWGNRNSEGQLTVHSTHQLFNGNRDDVRRQAVAFALDGLVEQLNE